MQCTVVCLSRKHCKICFCIPPILTMKDHNETKFPNVIAHILSSQKLPISSPATWAGTIVRKMNKWFAELPWTMLNLLKTQDPNSCRAAVTKFNSDMTMNYFVGIRKQISSSICLKMICTYIVISISQFGLFMTKTVHLTIQ